MQVKFKWFRAGGILEKEVKNNVKKGSHKEPFFVRGQNKKD